MLVADAFFIIGCILLSFGAGFSFYHIPAEAIDDVIPLIVENNYSQNFSTYLSPGDTLSIGVKPYAAANLTLVLLDPGSNPLWSIEANYAGSPLNLTYNADGAGNYMVIVFENLSKSSNKPVYCEVEIMSVLAPSSSIRPYIIYGIVLILIGFASVVYSRKTGVKVKDVEEWHNWRSYFLPSLFLASTIGFALISSTYLSMSYIQVSPMESVILVVFPALNVFTLLFGMGTLQGRPLQIFRKALFVAILAWIIIPSLVMYLIPYVVASNLYNWNPDLFVRSVQSLAGMNSALFGIETLVVIVVIAYGLSLQYSKHRVYGYILEVEAIEPGNLDSLMRRLGSALGKNSLEEFFKKLREQDLETSVFLYFLLSDYVESGVNSFTYHGVIADRRNVFSKDIYERKPAEKILRPLGYLRVIGEDRFKTFSLQTERPSVSRLTALFKSVTKRDGKESIEKWAGVNLLKERRRKYSGLTKEKGILNEENHHNDKRVEHN
ncbi:MAG: hypothetical protein WED05_06190 [Candidatus Atabeyarchaeum deiterrae]